MIQKFAVLLAVGCMTFFAAAAQKERDERREERREGQAEKKAANDTRVDYNVFRRQILSLPEFADERKKIAELKKKSGGMPKIYAVVDSLNDNEDSKTLTGFITTTLGDNSANVYEITYDRATKKIVKVKPTGEKLEVEKAEPEEKRKPVAQAKPAAKKPVKKKKTGDEEDEEEADEEENEPDEKPVKGRKKEEEDD